MKALLGKRYLQKASTDPHFVGNKWLMKLGYRSDCDHLQPRLKDLGGSWSNLKLDMGRSRAKFWVRRYRIDARGGSLLQRQAYKACRQAAGKAALQALTAPTTVKHIRGLMVYMIYRQQFR